MVVIVKHQLQGYTWSIYQCNFRWLWGHLSYSKHARVNNSKHCHISLARLQELQQPEALWLYQTDIELEIRSMERGICPIAVFYFALKRNFL